MAANPTVPLNRNTYGGVKLTVRAILGDTKKSWTTDAYLDPIVQHVFDLQILYLLDSYSPFITRLVLVPGLPAGTSDLTSYQNNAGEQTLFGLMEPLRLDWKLPGQPEINFVEVTKTDNLPNYTPTAPQPLGRLYWEWRSNTLFLSPVPFPIDLRVRGEFLPAPLIKDEQLIPLHPLLHTALAEESAACASRERANPGQMQTYVLVGKEALDNIANALVRDPQDTTTRMARASNRRGTERGAGVGPWGY